MSYCPSCAGYEKRIAELEAQIIAMSEDAKRLRAEPEGYYHPTCQSYALVDAKGKAIAHGLSKEDAAIIVAMSERSSAYFCDKHEWPYGAEDDSGPICPWCERLKVEQLSGDAKRLREALQSIVGLMKSMQSLGYFTNDEWATRLERGEAALATERQPPGDSNTRLNGL